MLLKVYKITRRQGSGLKVLFARKPLITSHTIQTRPYITHTTFHCIITTFKHYLTLPPRRIIHVTAEGAHHNIRPHPLLPTISIISLFVTNTEHPRGTQFSFLQRQNTRPRHVSPSSANSEAITQPILHVTTYHNAPILHATTHKYTQTTLW